MDIAKLGQEALSKGLINDDIFNDIREAGKKRNTVLPFRKSISITTAGEHFDNQRNMESEGYEAVARRMMIVVSQFLNKSSI